MQRRGYPAPPLVEFGDLATSESLTSASCFRHPDEANKVKDSVLSSEIREYYENAPIPTTE